jgi:hypothetical protein
MTVLTEMAASMLLQRIRCVLCCRHEGSGTDPASASRDGSRVVNIARMSPRPKPASLARKITATR